MGSLINIDLKGLPEASVQLAKIVADAIAGAARPWQIRRIGAAEADVQRLKTLTQTQTEIECDELEKRSLHRFLQEEMEKQLNMEEIASEAIRKVSDKAQPDKISKDWITAFFDQCRLTSDNEMQQLWSRVLAGEAEHPGRFAKRTIDVIAKLDKNDALSFERLCSFTWQMKAARTPLIYDFESPSLRRAELTFESFLSLQESGLIAINDGSGFAEDWDPPMSTVSYFDTCVQVHLAHCLGDNPVQISLGSVMFTRAGRDLATICKSAPIPEFFDEVVSCWQKDYRHTVKPLTNPITAPVEGEAKRGILCVVPPRTQPARWG